jgi:hypothetical protein
MPALQRRSAPRTATPTRSLACLCTLAILAMACGGPGNTIPTKPGTREQPSYTALEVANYAVESAYEQFWLVLELLDQDPPERWPDELAAVATEPELSRQLHAATMRHDTRSPYTKPTTHIRAIHGAFGTTATIEDCQDTPNRSRIPVTGILFRPTPPFGDWRVREVSYPTGTC